MSLSADSISRKHRKDLEHLRRRSTWARWLVIVGMALLILVPAASWWSEVAGPRGGSARNALFLEGASWGRELLLTHSEYRTWLGNIALPVEVRLFDALAEALFYSAQFIRGERDDLSFLANLLVSAHFAALRVAFILVASWKWWLLAIIWGLHRSRRNWKAYVAPDLLGQTGNGRIFYSGVRVALENLDSKGRPQAQVVGLACVPYLPIDQVKESTLGKALSAWQVDSATNLVLAGMLLKFSHYPSYVAERPEVQKLEEVYEGAPLPAHAEELLEVMLSLHATLGDDEPPRGVDRESVGTRLSSNEYAQRLGRAAMRVLTPTLRAELVGIEAREVATMVLAIEAGKILAYGFEGEKWLRKSNFPQLSARAVLHSVSEFAEDYGTEARARIRNAIIFGSRRSVFAPVRLPRGLSAACRGLRQWAELLLAAPHELAAVTDEVEMLGLVTEAHEAWQDRFFAELRAQRSELCDGAYATQSNLALFPLPTLLRTLRAVIAPEIRARLEVLLQAVSQRQRVEALALDQGADAQVVSRAVREQVVAPLSHQESKELVAEHQQAFTLEDVRDWSSFRVVLQMFGWLARRVGDYTVPPSSVILVAVKPEERTAECNTLGLVARRGMVPLRVTRIADQLGKQWYFALERAMSARMAVSEEQLARFMSGARDEVPSEDGDGIMNPRM